MTTFTVNNLNDSGAGSFRAAILAANADGSGLPVEIKFSVSGVVHLASDLPTISKTVQIDGTSAPGYITAGHPVVEIDFNSHAGLTFSAGSAGSALLGLALGNAAGNGVTLNSSNITLNKNYIGLHIDGSTSGNSGDGVFISPLSSNNKIGDNPTAASGFIGNVISGNGGNGVSVHGSYGNVLVDNHIGTTVNGAAAIANGLNGILLTDGSGSNTIGGTAYVDTSTGAVNNPTGNKGTTAPTFVVPPLGNLVSGNGGNGIFITNNSQNNVLNGNFVGTTADGNGAIGNGLNGVYILNAGNNSLIGCDFSQNPFVYYNVLSGNGGNGLRVTNSNNVTVQANFFGVGANNASFVANSQNGILVDGNSQNVQVGGVIPLGNVSAGNKLNGIHVTDTVSGFTTFNTFGGLFAFQGAAPNGNDGILIDSTGGNNHIRTNVFSGNTNNGIEIAGNASGVTVDPNIAGLNTVGNATLANGGNGLLITDTAHGNMVGGFLDSVIPQNTFSGNKGYGVAITGAGYSNTMINSTIGTDVLKTSALGNQSGGILLATSGANNLIGGATTDPRQPQSNYISGNSGNGIDFSTNTSGNQLVDNLIGVDRFGVSNLPNSGQPIALNGAYANNVSGNTATPAAISLGLPPQEVMQQLESLYIGYYGRAGDVTGVSYWSNQTLKALQAGSTLYNAINQVSAAFATSAENGPYAALANVPLNPNNPTQVALATSFIKNVYEHSFGRAADATGVTFWLDSLFSGRVPFTSLVNVMNNAAQLTDLTNLENKMLAAGYFTEITEKAGVTPNPVAMSSAVNNVTNDTSLLASKAATNAYFGISENQMTYASAFQTNVVTGVRGEYDGNVVLTGSVPVTTAGVTTVTASLYSGPMQDTALGYLYALTPQINGQSIESSTFYGPNTSIFDPSIGRGNVIAVGSFVLNSSSDVHDHGMIYKGPVSGGGSWTQIDVPTAVAGASVADTIAHSVMGDLVVGNYDLVGVPDSGNAFIYNKATKSWTIMDQAFGGTQQDTTLYGVWQNGVGSTSYTLVGGSNHGGALQQGFIADYNSVTGQISHLTYLPAYNDPKDFSHIEGITAIAGGYNLSATTPNGPGYVTVTRNADGTFATTAEWTNTAMPGVKITSGNSIYQNINMGVYILPDTASSDALSTYTAVVGQSTVDHLGGLIMKMGSLNYSYSTTVPGGVGALLVGSTSAGNILGGSIGNDIFVGEQNADKSDTIFTGGGADQVQLAAARTASTHVELYASNQINSTQAFVPGATMPALAGSVVSASDIPQLGWWGQATGQVGGPVSNVTTNLGHGVGTSADITIVSNFNIGSGAVHGDSIDMSLTAFSNLLRSMTPSTGPALGNAVLSNAVAPGGTITVANADVIVLSDMHRYADAAAVAKALTAAATSINFSTAQTNSVNHYVLAYEDMTGNTRLADLDIHNASAFTNTASVATLAVSDLVQLTGVDLSIVQTSNIQFVA